MADENTATEEAAPEERVAKSDGKPTITTKVYAPFKVYYEGEAYSLSAINATGPFDVLPGHHNFLCMLVPCDLTIETSSGQKTIKIHRALMHVKADHVTVFMDV